MTSASVPAPRARLDDLVAGTSLQFGRFAREIRAERPEEVRPALAEIEQAVADGAWAVVMIAVAGLAVGLGGSFSTEFEIPGTESQAGLDSLATRFPEMGGTSGDIVFVAEDGSDIDEHQGAIEDTMEDVAQVEGVETAPSPFDDLSPGTRNDEDTALIATVQMDGQIGEFPAESVDELQAIVDDASAESSALSVHLGGQVLKSGEVPFGAGEVIGVILALIILGIVFRAVIPAVIPIVTAIVGVGASMMAQNDALLTAT